MKKLIISMALVLVLVGLTACGTPKAEEGAVSDAQTLTGVVEEVRAGMLIVTPEGGDSAVFSIQEDVEFEAGDKVTVTYTGDLSDGAKVTNIEKTE